MMPERTLIFRVNGRDYEYSTEGVYPSDKQREYLDSKHYGIQTRRIVNSLKGIDRYLGEEPPNPRGVRLMISQAREANELVHRELPWFDMEDEIGDVEERALRITGEPEPILK